jgi:hypothetical protein
VNVGNEWEALDALEADVLKGREEAGVTLRAAEGNLEAARAALLEEERRDPRRNNRGPKLERLHRECQLAADLLRRARADQRLWSLKFDVLAIERERQAELDDISGRLEWIRERLKEGRLTPEEHKASRRALLAGSRALERLRPSPAAEPPRYPSLPAYHDVLLQEGPYEGDGTHEIAFAAYCAGWDEGVLLDALLDPRNRGGLPVQQKGERDSEEAARREVSRLWQGAERHAKRTESSRKEERYRALARLCHVRRLADALLWRGESGYTDLYVLHALLDLGEANDTQRVSASARQLGLLVGIEKDTASDALRRLCEMEWLEPSESEKQAHATLYEVRVPRKAPRVQLRLPGVMRADDGTPLIAHDAFHRDALGKARFHLWRVMASRLEQPWSVKELAFILGLTERVVRHYLRPPTRGRRGLQEAGLVFADGPWRYAAAEPDGHVLREVAEEFGTWGVGEERRRRYEQDSRQWQEAVSLFKRKATD